MPTVQSAGVPIHFEVIGQGRPIVLLHGFSSSFDGNWRRSGWVDFLVGEGSQVIGVDCRGHGMRGVSRGNRSADTKARRRFLQGPER